MRLVWLWPILVFSAAAQQDPPSWMAFGAGATVTATAEGAALSYELRPKQISAAAMPAPPTLAHMKRLRLRAKSDHDTALAVVLGETMPGGGRYLAWFWAPAGVWQTVELTPADFIASDGPQDPVDADGRLDLDAVENIAVIDLAAFFGSLPENPDFPVVVAAATGKHTLVLDQFEILPAEASAGTPARGRIDGFDRGFLQWVTLGGMDLKLSRAGNPLNMPALQAAYTQAEGQFELLIRRISNLDLSQATAIGFDIASERESTIVVSLEEKKGARHNLTIYPPGGREVFHVRLKLADFEGPGKVDATQLKSLMLADITATEGGTPGKNTIWIGNVTATMQ